MKPPSLLPRPQAGLQMTLKENTNNKATNTWPLSSAATRMYKKPYLLTGHVKHTNSMFRSSFSSGFFPFSLYSPTRQICLKNTYLSAMYKFNIF